MARHQIILSERRRAGHGVAAERPSVAMAQGRYSPYHAARDARPPPPPAPQIRALRQRPARSGRDRARLRGRGSCPGTLAVVPVRPRRRSDTGPRSVATRCDSRSIPPKVCCVTRVADAGSPRGLEAQRRERFEATDPDPQRAVVVRQADGSRVTFAAAWRLSTGLRSEHGARYPGRRSSVQPCSRGL